MASKCQENASEENVLENQETNITTSVVEPTAPDAHSDQPTIVVPTSDISTQTTSIPIPKSKRKNKKKVSLGVEMPETPTITQKQQTYVVTSSQQLQTSPPNHTPHLSSQKDNVVSKGEPSEEGDDSPEYLFSSPSPKATSLFTPPPTKILPLTFQSLLDVIDKTGLCKPSSCQPQITKSLPQQVSGASSEIIASPQAKAIIPLVSQETLEGVSSESATKIAKTTVSQLDSGYITKTSLRETTVESTIVHSIIVGSP
ncbi:hypothetical protein Hanom_Chr17g01565411 [Helianthus anomalus]